LISGGDPVPSARMARLTIQPIEIASGQHLRLARDEEVGTVGRAGLGRRRTVQARAPTEAAIIELEVQAVQQLGPATGVTIESAGGTPDRVACRPRLPLSAESRVAAAIKPARKSAEVACLFPMASPGTPSKTVVPVLADP
jgi:hypothetical protein